GGLVSFVLAHLPYPGSDFVVGIQTSAPIRAYRCPRPRRIETRIEAVLWRVQTQASRDLCPDRTRQSDKPRRQEISPSVPQSTSAAWVATASLRLQPRANVLSGSCICSRQPRIAPRSGRRARERAELQ